MVDDPSESLFPEFGAFEEIVSFGLHRVECIN